MLLDRPPATPPIFIAMIRPRDRMDARRIEATHEGKGKLFLDGWKEEDLYSNPP